MKRYVVISLLCFVAVHAFGQTFKIEGLKHAVTLAKPGAAKLKALLDLLDENETLPEDTLWSYALKAKALASQEKDLQSYSMGALAQARAYLRWDNVDSARAIIEPELAKYNAENPALRKIYFELAQTRFGIIGNNSNYKAGMPFVYDVMRKAEFYKDSIVVANCMNTLAAWNYDMDFVTESRTWDYKALSYTNPDDPRFYSQLIGIYNTIGDNYRWIRNTDSATYFIDKAIALCKKTEKLYWLSSAMQRKSTIYLVKKDYPKAEQAILEALRIIQLVEGKAPQLEKLMVQAAIYEHWGQLDKAIKILNEGLAFDKSFKRSSHASKSSSSTDLTEVFYNQELAKCYKLKGHFKQYSATLEKIIDGKDLVYKANSADALAELETKYEVQKKEATIARQKLNLAKAAYFLWASVIFVVLGAIIIWLIFRDFRRKQRIKMLRLQEEEKRLSTKAVADAEESERKRIAADLHDNLGAQLSFIKRNVNYIIDQPHGFNQSDEKKYLEYVKDIAQNAIIDLRETIWVLNKDEVTVQEFADKLKSYLRQQLLDKDMIRWEFHENIAQSWMLTSGHVMHLFRIVQEIVSNAIKHSEGDHIHIEFNSCSAGTYQLTIADNGTGFKIDQQYDGHYGMENIQNRAKEIDAEFIVTSEPGSGTRVMINKGQNNSFELFNSAATTSNFTK